MADPFLAELDEMIPKDTKSKKRHQFNQHITTRGNYVSSTPESASKSVPKLQVPDNSEIKSGRTSNDQDQFLKVPVRSPRRSSDPKKPPKVSPKKKELTKSKVLSNRDNLKDSKKIEKTAKECSSVSSDGSSKENDQPLTKSTKLEGSMKKPYFSEATDVTALINVIKDLISNYTKAEGLKIMHRLGEMHVDLTSEIVKQLFMQTDDLLEELKPTRNVNHLRMLVSENERLKENIMILQMRNEELTRRVQETASIKEENIKLKIKLKELSKQM